MVMVIQQLEAQGRALHETRRSKELKKEELLQTRTQIMREVHGVTLGFALSGIAAIAGSIRAGASIFRASDSDISPLRAGVATIAAISGAALLSQAYIIHACGPMAWGDAARVDEEGRAILLADDLYYTNCSLRDWFPRENARLMSLHHSLVQADRALTRREHPVPDEVINHIFSFLPLGRA